MNNVRFGYETLSGIGLELSTIELIANMADSSLTHFPTTNPRPIATPSLSCSLEPARIGIKWGNVESWENTSRPLLRIQSS
jgi:hypothetical protein